ncbi:MAG: type II toxin-antitoxin system RelE/ParE family toxin [Candidatus Pelethousia sp.]|nr:type II toxin-antitoxin system RelE/ParE family toxin [Candidatus Pelethousia sp.]
MNKLYLSGEAQNDLAELRLYISQELANPDAAQNAVSEIIRRLRMLEVHAQLGAPLSSITGLESDYRFLVCGNYLAFYRVGESAIFVDRILYSRRDYIRILFGEISES